MLFDVYHNSIDHDVKDFLLSYKPNQHVFNYKEASDDLSETLIPVSQIIHEAYHIDTSTVLEYEIWFKNEHARSNIHCDCMLPRDYLHLVQYAPKITRKKLGIDIKFDDPILTKAYSPLTIGIYYDVDINMIGGELCVSEHTIFEEEEPLLPNKELIRTKPFTFIKPQTDDTIVFSGYENFHWANETKQKRRSVFINTWFEGRPL